MGASLLALAKSIYYPYKKLQCDCQEKKYTFLSSQNRHKFFIFSAIASKALIQISQPAN